MRKNFWIASVWFAAMVFWIVWLQHHINDPWRILPSGLTLAALVVATSRTSVKTVLLAITASLLFVWVVNFAIRTVMGSR